MRNGNLVRLVKEAAKQPYAWPGGYPKMAVTSDGGTLCCKCLRAEFPRVGRSTRDAAKDGFQVVAVEVHWEGPDMTCDHCNTAIPSAYGDPGNDPS